MRFPNAAKGVKNIFTAQILMLIGAICEIIGFIILVGGLMAADATKGSNAGVAALLGGSMGSMLLLAAYSILSLIAFIMQIVGIVNAKKDEESFKSALICLIIGIVATIIGGLFMRLSRVVFALFMSVGSLMGAFVIIFIISGCIKLADQLNRGDVSTKGSNILKMIVVIAGLSVILSIVSSFMMANVAIMVTAMILAVVSVVLSIVQYIMFLTFLSQSKKMLNEEK
ncbi:MAG TPA: hypothetical protein DCY72_03200 [Ruminococcaceae bacterium]|nr:hypothetical protein [Oscillospiraceae bacterium]